MRASVREIRPPRAREKEIKCEKEETTRERERQTQRETEISRSCEKGRRCNKRERKYRGPCRSAREENVCV